MRRSSSRPSAWMVGWWTLLRLLSTTEAAAVVEPYHLKTTAEIHERLLEWNTTFPDLIRVSTSQQKYGFPRAGENAEDCPEDLDDQGLRIPGCLNYFFVLQDFVRHPEGSDSSQGLPSLLLSGSLHGNERVGPTVVMETAALLLEAATCREEEDLEEEDEIHLSSCQQWEENRGLSRSQRKWLTRLVKTRRIVGVPAANALGYFRNERTEDGIDPNRDFPYDVLDPTSCMQSLAGRTLNELFREHIVQLSFTFHAGTELLGYEWGNPSWYFVEASPDDLAQNQLAATFSKIGGEWSKHPPYRYGSMNEIIYHVRGGMEDWAYAGSWDLSHTTTCRPNTYGGYPESKTLYDPADLRAFNLLVETSWRKSPEEDDLGTNYNLLDSNNDGDEEDGTGKNNGHIPRNIRLSLSAMDLVEPYVSIVGVNDLVLSDEISPLGDHKNRSCSSEIRTVSIPANTTNIVLHWTVGGALKIDETQAWISNPNAPVEDIRAALMDCRTHPRTEDIEKVFSPLSRSVQTGSGFFSSSGPEPLADDTTLGGVVMGPIFSSTIMDLSTPPSWTERTTTPQEKKNDSPILVLVSARVDSSWSELPVGKSVGPSNFPPQAHVVNARTNPDWYFENSHGKVVQGRLDWFSIPLLLVVDDQGLLSKPQELSHHDFFETTTTSLPSPSPTANPTTTTKPVITDNPISTTDVPTESPPPTTEDPTDDCVVFGSLAACQNVSFSTPVPSMNLTADGSFEDSSSSTTTTLMPSENHLRITTTSTTSEEETSAVGGGDVSPFSSSISRISSVPTGSPMDDTSRYVPPSPQNPQFVVSSPEEDDNETPPRPSGGQRTVFDKTHPFFLRRSSSSKRKSSSDNE